ncbi:MAG: NAD-glutamate dehydrogenase [Gammaproteobacteria bacterium]|nr:NAD-glutamate dehydrogenase [Gammaproteobacteria bacterium]
MSSVNSTRKDTIDRKKIVKKVVACAKKRVESDEVKLLTSFIELYFSNVPIEDIAERSTKALFGAVCSHWNLLKTRKPHQSKIKIFNPTEDKNDWQSTHTIVEVIHDDIPFLVDSLRMEINSLGYTIHLIIHSGGMKVYRDKAGHITTVLPIDSKATDAITEAPIYFEIDKQTDPQILNNLTENLQRILIDVQLAVNDWKKMQNRVGNILEEMVANPPPLKHEDIEESKTFLEWLKNDHFTFLGSREYVVVEIDGDKALQLVPNTGLGVLKDEGRSKVIRYYDELPSKARKQALSKQILIISKTNTISTVHRPTYTDYIGVKKFDERGEIIALTLFIGLYTSEAYNSKLSDIPFIRDKVQTILEKSGLTHNSHALKTLQNILDTFPRDDMFQGNVDMLCEIMVGILHLQDRKRIRMFVLEDLYGRYVSCLVYVPRDNLSTDLIYRMQAALVTAFNGRKVTFTTYFPESVLTRIHFVIRVDPKKKLNYDLKQIENELIHIGRSWKDDLQEEILANFGEEAGIVLMSRYERAFPAGYREAYLPRNAIYDIHHLEKLSEAHDLELSIYHPTNAAPNNLRFKLYRLNNSIPLSDVLPILENMGLRVIGEQPFQVSYDDGSMAWINDFNMLYNIDDALDINEIKDIFQEAFHKIWYGYAENDGFNKLVLGAKLTWREISVLRAYAKFLRQLGFTFSQQYIEDAFSTNPVVARLLMDLFNLIFDPAITKKADKISFIEEELSRELDNVANLDEDRILRRYLEVMKATLRTNYYQQTHEGEYKPYLSLKFNSSLISDIPLPIPMFETFVYSTDFEGVHLRTGKVARGGLRWSNRREDFRTEVLGLMKAQQVKNAIIVPSGAKGGFVVKNLPLDANRGAMMEAGVNCYRNFIRGLLDIADNLVGGSVIRPSDTVCFDEEDPYLVVAADKGTATFSDIANDIAAEYGFWLDDAFASGGSTGYDHKKIGITARGAWESVKSHFRELTIDPYHDDFTVIGIGDMAGDVFGNGMLYTDHIKLIAAFNHTHIFIDPNPDTKLSYFERLRLFKLPASTWEDYDPSLISKGGGVFKRSVKSIKLSSEARAVLGISKEAIIPNDLIKAILKAPVDLFWNGGIGTYVKSSAETHSEIGDRANDALRINGNELHCKAVAEGGNLGFTQLGRIEFELSGGKINTDFIDNSGGVDCSDHEVNIKILLNQLIVDGVLTEKKRNQLLSEMTDEVAQLVLYDNYYQTRSISFAVSNSMTYLELYRLFMQSHEMHGNLNRPLEFLPDDKTINERKANHQGLTRPEIAVLMAYSKNILKKEILNTKLPEEKSLSEYIELAFPRTLCRRYASQMQQHHLRREIIATQLSNHLVTEMGTTFVYQINDENNASTEEIVRAYMTTRKLFDLHSLWTQVEALEHKISIEVQNEMILDIMRLGRRATRWVLLNKRYYYDIDEMVAHFSPYLTKVAKILPTILFGQEKEKFEARTKYLISEGVPEDIATKISATRPLYSALNIIEAAITNKVDVLEVAKIYFKIMERLELIWFREKINDYPVDNHWAVLARADYKGDLDYLQRILTVSVIKFAGRSKHIDDHVNKWLESNKKHIARWKAVLGELRSTNTNEFAMLTVAMRGLLELAQVSRQEGQTEGFCFFQEA